MTIVKRKRGRIDKCNICLECKTLTWDHVPPKSGIILTSVEIGNIFSILANKNDPHKSYSQNGVKYRTLCGSCNSRLGSEYDSVYNDLNKVVSLFLKSSLQLPAFTYVKTKPARLIRAILGHLMAAKTTIGETVFDVNVRKFTFSHDEKLPEDIHIHYWIYPYDCTIIARDFAIPAVRGNFSDFLLGHVLKYFPLGFLISDKPEYAGLPALTKFRDLTIDEEAELRVDLKLVNTFDWLMIYTTDGKLNIDNNPVENSIRPVAIGY